MLPRNTVLRDQMENPFPQTLYLLNLNANIKNRPKENAPPPDPNSVPSPAATSIAKLKSPLPPRPPSSNPPKGSKLYTDTLPENAISGISDFDVW